MGKYKFLFAIYLVALLSYAVANYIGADVQNFYRVPGAGIKWIDVAIILIIGSFFYQSTIARERFRNPSTLTVLCFFYLLFETVQLYRTWGTDDAQSQLSHYLCTLAFFIIIEASTFTLPVNKIAFFLKKFAVYAAVVLLISNLYLIYSFVTGNVVFGDVGDVRASLDVKGSKESIYPAVLIPYVYAYGLYFLQQRTTKPIIKLLFIVAIISIYASIIVTFYRGNFITVLVITCYFLFTGKGVAMMKRAAAFVAILAVGYLLFGSVLADKGYDPVQKVVEVAQFTTDTNNPEWDKGRSLSQAYALAAWQQSPWFGYGYDGLFNHGLPDDVASAHNGVITSLFHRGVIGTILLMWIIVLLFKNAIQLWRRLKRGNSFQEDMMKLLVLVSFFWIIPFMTQEALWEKFSFCVQMMYFGLILNYLRQLKQAHTVAPAPELVTIPALQ